MSMSGNDQTKLRALRAFRDAVQEAFAVLGAGPTVAEVLKTLVHAGQGEEDPGRPVLKLEDLPTDAANLALMRKLARQGKTWKAIRGVLAQTFRGTGASSEFVARRLEIYRELFLAREKPRTVTRAG